MTLPGKPLSPELKAHTDKLYLSDKLKYRRLILWVWHQQKRGYSDEAIRICLVLAEPYLKEIELWWPYLTKIMPKAAGQAHEKEGAKVKSEIGHIAQEFIEFLRIRNAR